MITSRALSLNFVQEAPASGASNGSNTAFTSSATPYSSGSFQVYLDGLYVDPSLYSLNISTKTVTFTTAPNTGQVVRFSYLAKN